LILIKPFIAYSILYLVLAASIIFPVIDEDDTYILYISSRIRALLSAPSGFS
jgi:hypothetical protein